MADLRFLTPVLLVSFLLDVRVSSAQSLVAETTALTAEEQAKRFHLPPGFEIQLVAEEPAIHKPMNMKFDARGRLWVTHSVEYPVPAANDDSARDAITILGDLGQDGRARTASRFAEHLNIPMGVLPVEDRHAIAWSIPNIYRLTDADGDGVAEHKSVLFGPFGVADVHGNQNSFTQWIDGWVYANHGFSNDSHIKAGGVGDEKLHLQSGNTYRFRADGSSIEQHSWGQVNPFGLSFDPLGNLYSADCHSSAVSMLLRGGYYQSFGKPHDGLGFAPVMTNKDHGGTGIAGVAYSATPNFPAEYRDVLFVGNVITNRVHCDRLKWTGSSPVVEAVEDFVTCDDPWFRPVDIQVGPDGALYIADFYNCIIGHYEVPLDHPKRDRQRGRIWRVVYKGDESTRSAPPMPNLHQLEPDRLFALLGHANLAVRVLATNRLVEEFPEQAAELAQEFLLRYAESFSKPENARAAQAYRASHALWVLNRTSSISEVIATALLHDQIPRQVQVHLAKALGETREWTAWHIDAVHSALNVPDPFVRRAAAEALGKHPSAENIAPLLALLGIADPQDVQLVHQIRIAIRDQIVSPSIANDLLNLPLETAQREQLVEFAATAPNGPAAVIVFDQALRGRVSADALLDALPTAARYVDAARLDAMVAHVDATFTENLSNRLAALAALAEALIDRNLPLSDALQSKLVAVIGMAMAGEVELQWHNLPHNPGASTASPWAHQQRPVAQGMSIDVVSSLSGQGERGGGILRSPSFELPHQIKFSMCGHNGFPDMPSRQQNYVRLVLDDGTEVARSYPPRDDTARQYHWDLRGHAGKRGHIEVVDGITDIDGFAWIGVSNFEPSAPRLPHGPVESKEDARVKLIQLVGELKLARLKDQIEELAAASGESFPVRLAAARSLIALDPQVAIPRLSDILNNPDAPLPVRIEAAEQFGRIDSGRARSIMLAALPSAPHSLAVTLAANVAVRSDSAKEMLEAVEHGKVSPTILLEPRVLERLRQSGLPNIEELLTQLTRDVEPASTPIENLIAERRGDFLAGTFSPEKGREIFAKSVCANCHRIGSVGSVIGPALDGIGNRGLERLLEDSLDPNRNVDPAFRSVNFLTEDGLVMSGFGVREDGDNWVYFDTSGKEQRLPKVQVLEQAPSQLSPMPSDIAETISKDDYLTLLSYLLSLKKAD